MHACVCMAETASAIMCPEIVSMVRKREIERVSLETVSVC